MTTAFGRAKILLSEAIKEDHAGNAEEAFKWYKQGCTELLDAIKETSDPKQQAGYSKALKNYLLRAEQMKKLSVAQMKAATPHRPWEELFGVNVHLEDSSSCLLKPEAALKDKKVVCLYFVCPTDKSTSSLTPRLGSLYSSLSNRNALEVVFCSSDRSQSEFSANFAPMPWLALPFEERRVVGKLRQRFGLASNTTEIVVLEGGSAKVLKTNGKDDFQGLGDPSSWVDMASSSRGAVASGASRKPQNRWADTLLGEQIRLRDGRVLSASEALAGKRVVVLLFSAHWKDGCAGVCDKLLLLHTMYSGQCGGTQYSPFEVVWISSEKSESEWNQVYQNLPFAALPFNERRIKGRLEHAHGVFPSTLPKVVVLDGGNGRALIKDATQILREGVSDTEYPVGEDMNIDLVKKWLLSSSLPGNFGVPIARITSVPVKGYTSPIPKVLVHLWFQLVKRGGLRVEGIFRISPSKREEGKLVAQIDNNQWPDVSNPHASANLIKLFLRQLPNQLLQAVHMVLIPTSARAPDFMAEHAAKEVPGKERNGKLRNVIRQIPEPARSVLLWLADRLVLVARARQDNKMDANALAIVVAPNLLDAPGSASSWNTNVMRDRQQHIKVLTNFTQALILMRDSASFAKAKAAAEDSKKSDEAKGATASGPKDPPATSATATDTTNAGTGDSAGADSKGKTHPGGGSSAPAVQSKPKTQTQPPKPKSGPSPGVFEPPDDAIPPPSTTTKPTADPSSTATSALKPQTSIGNNICVLSVKTLTGKNFFVKVSENMTFGAIKQEHLVEKVGGPAAAITLIKGGRSIPDAATPRLLGFGSSKGKAQTVLPLHLVKRKCTNQPPPGAVTPGVVVSGTAVTGPNTATPGVPPALKAAGATLGVNPTSHSTRFVPPSAPATSASLSASAVVAGTPITGSNSTIASTVSQTNANAATNANANAKALKPPSAYPPAPPSKPVTHFRAPPPTYDDLGPSAPSKPTTGGVTNLHPSTNTVTTPSSGPSMAARQPRAFPPSNKATPPSTSTSTTPSNIPSTIPSTVTRQSRAFPPSTNVTPPSTTPSTVARQPRAFPPKADTTNPATTPSKVAQLPSTLTPSTNITPPSTVTRQPRAFPPSTNVTHPSTTPSTVARQPRAFPPSNKATPPSTVAQQPGALSPNTNVIPPSTVARQPRAFPPSNKPTPPSTTPSNIPSTNPSTVTRQPRAFPPSTNVTPPSTTASSASRQPRAFPPKTNNTTTTPSTAPSTVPARPRAFSDASVSALSKLQSLSVSLSKHEHDLKQIQDSVVAPTGDLFELYSECKTELSVLNGRINKMQIEKDAVQTVMLTSGKAVAKVARKALNTRMESVLSSIQALYEDLTQRMSKLK